MADLAKKWPVAVNAAAGLVLAGLIGWQFIGGGAEDAAPVAEAPAAEAGTGELPVPAPAEKAEGAVGVDLEGGEAEDARGSSRRPRA